MMCKRILSTLSIIAFLMCPLSLWAQNSFSLSLDVDGGAGDQAVTSLTVSADQVVAIQIFGKDIQNANGLAVRFEYDASQVVYEGFEAGDVLPNAQALPEQGTNPTFIEIGITSLGGQATVNSALIGTIRFRATSAFSGTEIRLMRAELSRGGQIESVTLNVRVALQISVSTAPSPDFDGNGVVNIADFLAFVSQFGNHQGDGKYEAKYDLDSDGAIDISDFLSFVNDFGKEFSSPNSGGGSEGGSTVPDRDALVALYNATNGANWTNNTNWLTDAPLGEWHGVNEVDGEGRVVDLNLYRNNLTGPIPPELGGLSSLRLLVLGGNNLTGPIPSELGDLSQLENVYLYSNSLTGPIPPELGNLSILESLRINNNNLTGLIPPELLNLSLNAFQFENNAGLCAPGTAAFVAWLGGMDVHRGPFCNESDIAVLESLHKGAGGEGWTNSSGWLSDAPLEDWYGVRIDSLGRVRALDLSRNGLSGRLSAGLGNLARMTELKIGGNALSGRLPVSLARLSLQIFYYADTDLCAPSEEAFREWLKAIQSHEGTGVECAPLSDRDILVALYEATGGPSWNNNDNWLTDAPLADWYGVRVDGRGQVARLSLGSNALTGPIPPELGNLSNLTYLSLSSNALTGPIPPELGDLSQLENVYLYSNSLTGPIPPELGNLSNLERLWLYKNSLTGPIPSELGNLSSLERLDLGSNQLTGPIPPELGDLSSLERLNLRWNALTGPIPPELGNLSNLKLLWLHFNDLSGPIPSELGNLASLERLAAFDNALTGPIPSELGNLSSLTSLNLWGNALTGPIPPEFGNLSSLELLVLLRNNLSGPIPPELGNLSRLTGLYLENNNLTGPIPPELGNLSNLERLRLESNDLQGPVPPEFGGMASLLEMGLSYNGRLSGPLPTSFTTLRQLEVLVATSTDLCAPSDAEFLRWLEGVYRQRVPRCAEEGVPMAYLTQAVQSREFPVPLVAGEEALLRVFVTTARATGEDIPPVRATFYLDGKETHVVDIPGQSTAIPIKVNEGALSESANAGIPGKVLQPGLEMVVEIDPEGMLDSGLGVTKRIPETGRTAVEVRAMPVFDLTLIPFLWTSSPDSSILDITRGLTPDDDLLWDTRTLLPIGDFSLTVHDPVLSSTNSTFTLRDETKAIRIMEGGSGHYMGMMSGLVTGARGVAALSGRYSFSVPDSWTMAHELGHNLSLLHAPPADGPDPSFPHPNGRIGVWGYDFRDGGKLVPPNQPDLMSYDGPPRWISDYHFTNALRFRLFDEGLLGAAIVTAPARSLLLWGGVNADSNPYLDPAFVVDAPPVLPDSTGEYQLTGRTASGRELFYLSFAMPEVADGDGSSGFVFTLPVRPEWAESLASITLSGPGGSATLDGETDRPMTILRDPRNGQVRGILRDWTEPGASLKAARLVLPESGLEVMISRGVPDSNTWER